MLTIKNIIEALYRQFNMNIANNHKIRLVGLKASSLDPREMGIMNTNF